MINYHKHDMQTSLEICEALQGTFNRPGTYFEVCATCGEVRMEIGRLIQGNNPLHGNTGQAQFEEPDKLKALREEKILKESMPFLPESKHRISERHNKNRTRAQRPRSNRQTSRKNT